MPASSTYNQQNLFCKRNAYFFTFVKLWVSFALSKWYFQLKMKYGNFTEKDPTKLLTPKQFQGKHFQSYVLNNGKSIKLKRLHVR